MSQKHISKLLRWRWLMLFLNYLWNVLQKYMYSVYNSMKLNCLPFIIILVLILLLFFVIKRLYIRNNRRGRAKILILKLFRAKKVIGSQFCMNEYDFNSSTHTICMCFRSFNYLIKMYLLIYILLETFKNCFNCCSKML